MNLPPYDWSLMKEELKTLLIHVYNSGYMAGHHDTVESTFTDLGSHDYDTENEDVVAELVEQLAAGTEL